jgi:hypothetical protein
MVQKRIDIPKNVPPSHNRLLCELKAPQPSLAPINPKSICSMRLGYNEKNENAYVAYTSAPHAYAEADICMHVMRKLRRLNPLHPAWTCTRRLASRAKSFYNTFDLQAPPQA